VELDNYQLKKQSRYGPQASKVLVKKYLDGELHINYRGEDVAYTKLAARPVGGDKNASPVQARRKYVPSPEHPWKKSWRKK
jgi:hypothetical protein